jgi:hypothetical protein
MGMATKERTLMELWNDYRTAVKSGRQIKSAWAADRDDFAVLEAAAKDRINALNIYNEALRKRGLLK